MGSGPRTTNDGYTVHDRSKPYSSAGAGPEVDSQAMSDTPPPSERWGQEVPEITIRPVVSDVQAIPDVRRSARSAQDVDRSRPREMPAWFGPAVGVVTFVVVLGTGLSVMAVWFSYQVVTAPVPPPVPQEPTELEGVPVRKGLSEQPDR